MEDRFLLPLVLRGNPLWARFSVPFSNGGRTPEDAIQPEVAAVQFVSASWRNTSRLTGSTGRAKRATWLPRHLVRGVGAVGDSK